MCISSGNYKFLKALSSTHTLYPCKLFFYSLERKAVKSEDVGYLSDIATNYTETKPAVEDYSRTCP